MFSMKITVNGSCREVPDTQTLAELIATLGLGDAPRAVERNQAIVPIAEHENTELRDGDLIEIVTLVGGG